MRQYDESDVKYYYECNQNMIFETAGEKIIFNEFPIFAYSNAATQCSVVFFCPF